MNACVCCGREIPEGLKVCPQCEFSCKEPHIKDSGNRLEFSTGAVLDIQEGKGRCDLLPLDIAAEIVNDDILRKIADFKESSNTCDLQICIRYFMQVRNWNVYDMLLEVSKHFEEGAKKYGEYNWQKGIPIHCYIDSAVRHYLKWRRGDTDEPHDRAFVWNILCCIWTVTHEKELKVEVQ